MTDNRHNNYLATTNATNGENIVDDALNKLTNATCKLLLIFVFTIITILVLKFCSSDGFIYYALIGLPQEIATTLMDSINEALIQKNIVLSEQTVERITYVGSVYWVASSLSGYAVATKTFGVGLIQLVLKAMLCPFISPVVMPIVILVQFISMIKNIKILRSE